MNSEQRRALLGDALYEQIVREAQEWAAEAPPLTKAQEDRLRQILCLAPSAEAPRRKAA